MHRSVVSFFSCLSRVVCIRCSFAVSLYLVNIPLKAVGTLVGNDRGREKIHYMAEKRSFEGKRGQSLHKGHYHTCKPERGLFIL